MSDSFLTIEVSGRMHVVKDCKRPIQYDAKMKTTLSSIPSANYRGTGMGLCGILQPGQTLQEFTALYGLKKKGYTK